MGAEFELCTCNRRSLEFLVNLVNRGSQPFLLLIFLRKQIQLFCVIV